VISCPKCSKENQDHYKFCLGCGNELPRDGGGGASPAQKPFSPTPPAGIPAVKEAPKGSAGLTGTPSPSSPVPLGSSTGPTANPNLGAPSIPSVPIGSPPASSGGMPPVSNSPNIGPSGPAAPTSPSGTPGLAAKPIASVCPQCSSPNPRNNRFCITCGQDLSVADVAPVNQPVPTSKPAEPIPTGPTTPSRAKLILIRPDGTEGGTFQLNEGTTVIGRSAGPMFASDAYLSPRHSTFTVNGTAVAVQDDNSLNGVYVRIERDTPVEINDTDIFRIGQEILRFDAFKNVPLETDGTERQGAQIDGLVGRISLVVGRDTTANAFPVPVTGLFLGRERGEILFPEDGYVSGMHCQLSVENGKVLLIDRGSSNGTYIRIRGEKKLRNGDLLLMGQQLFRLAL